jgi:hypothetical protein
MTDNLSISRMTTNQSGKVTTFNNAMGQIDALMSESVDVDLTSGNVSKNSAQTLAAMMFKLTNATVAGRTLTLTAKKRFFMVEVDTTCTQTVDVKIGSGSVTVRAGFHYLFYSNGTTNHIALVSTADADALTVDGLAPAGGSTGEVLKKQSGSDFDYDWDTDATGSGVPVGGTIGQVLTKQSGTDYDTDWDDQSGVAVPWDFNPPAASHFGSNQTQGTGTTSKTDDSDVGLIQEYSWSGSSAAAAMDYKTIANSTFTVVAKIAFNARVVNFMNQGICLHESGTSKSYNFQLASNAGISLFVTRSTSLITFASHAATQVIPESGVVWLKIDLGITAANTYTFWHSADGKSWRQVVALGKTEYFTTAANRLGIFQGTVVSPGTNEKFYQTVSYWSDNA